MVGAVVRNFTVIPEDILVIVLDRLVMQLSVSDVQWSRERYILELLDRIDSLREGSTHERRSEGEHECKWRVNGG